MILRHPRKLACCALTLQLVLAGCGGRDPAAPTDTGDGNALTALGRATWQRVAAAKLPSEMPALNVAVLDALAEFEPGLAAHRAQIEAEERAAVRAVFTNFAPPAAVAWHAQPIALPTIRGQRSLFDLIIPVAQAAEAGFGELQTAAIGTNFTRFAGGGLRNGPPNQEVSRTEYPGKNGPQASLVVTTDGNGVAEATLETKADLPPFLMEANSKVSIKTTSLCPDANGKVSLTIKQQQGGHAGAGGAISYSKTLEAQVDITVNDEAEIASTDIQTHYSQQGSGGGGKSTAIEGRSGWHAGDASSGAVQSTSHNPIAGDSTAIEKGATDSLVLGQTAAQAAQSHWQSGACIRINAKSPGGVRRAARTQIPVSVVHRLAGGEISAKVTAQLTGGESLEPTKIARTPGTLTHTAPDEKRAEMSIALTAVSRRGKAQETLNLSINEDQYDIEGGADEFHGTGLICDLSQPFEVEGSGVSMKFTPSSASGGSYSYTGTMSGFAVNGNGTYTVATDGEVATSITATGPGSVKTPLGVVTKNGTEQYTLTPTQNAYCN